MSFSSFTPLAVYPGNGVQKTFAIPDKFYDIEDVRCYTVNAAGVETQLTRGLHYSVQVVLEDAEKPALKEGNVVLVAAPPVGTDVVPLIFPDVDQDQPFSGRTVTPRQHERTHDRAVMLSAALLEVLNRSYRSPFNLPPALRFIARGRNGYVATWDANGNLIEGPSLADIGAVIANIQAVIDVAAISSYVVTVAAVAPEVVIVAGIASSVNTVAAASAEVQTLAPISAQIVTVAANADNIETVAENIDDVTNFAKVYLGPKAADPATRNDGTALQVGDLYFKTTTPRKGLNTYDGTIWETPSAIGVADGAVTRAKLAPVLKDFGSVPVNIREYGTNGAAFVSAHAAVPAGEPILVPAGTYALSGNINLAGRRLIFLGNVVVTGGKMIGAVIERHDIATGTRSFGSGVPIPGTPHQADYKFGDTLNNIVRRGLVFGGGNPDNGTDGTRFSLDSYSGWAVAQNTKYGGAQEFAFQSNAISGDGERYAGDDYIYTTYDMFTADHVGKYVYHGTGEIYLIYAVANPRSIRVRLTDGSPVTWSAYKRDAIMMVWVGGTGTAIMSGDTIARVAGDPFVVKGISAYFVRINGTIYPVNVWIDPSTMTLSGASFPNGTPVTYEFWTTINHLSSRIVVQRANGLGGAEECVSLEAYADGKFKLQALSSFGTFPFSGSQRPFHIGNGYSSGGGERTQILLDGVAGDTFIGGGYERASLRVTSREGVVSNNVRISGAAASAPPEISAEGAAADVDLVVTAKGSGMVRIGGSISGATTTGADRTLFVKDYNGNILKINCKV